MLDRATMAVTVLYLPLEEATVPLLKFDQSLKTGHPLLGPIIHVSHINTIQTPLNLVVLLLVRLRRQQPWLQPRRLRHVKETIARPRVRQLVPLLDSNV